MKIVVKLLVGRCFILESESTDTTDHIKAKVHSILHTPPDRQRIIYLGTQLEDGHTLAAYSVKEGSVLCIIPTLRGGASGEIERPLGKQEDVNESYDIYNIYYGDAFFQSGWRDEHDKELLQLLLKDGTISGGNIQEAAWLSIQNCLNNSQNCNFEIDFLKERLREYNQWYSLLVDETSSSIFHWNLANEFIRVKSDELDYEMPLSGGQISYLKSLQMLVNQDISRLPKIRAKLRKFRKCLT